MVEERASECLGKRDTDKVQVGVKIKVYVKVQTLEILLARKDEPFTWLASQMSLSSNYAWNVLNGKCPITPDNRKKLWDVFRGMSTHDGRAKWDDLFVIKECEEA